MIDASDFPAYMSEISKITETCVNDTKIYIRYRAIGEGFEANAFWLKDAKPSAIQFFNGINSARELAVVMSVWKIMEVPAKGKFIPGEIASRTRPNQRRMHDEIRSLPRLSRLFREACGDGYNGYLDRYATRQNEIAIKHNLPVRDVREFREKIYNDRDSLIAICDKIDALSASDTHRDLDIARNEGFAHSSRISRKFITSGLSEDDYKFTRQILFHFGDEVMQLALYFDSIWNQRNRPSIADSIRVSVNAGASFWDDLRVGFNPGANQ
ncbi:hypothetical protein [Paracoccus yeei]|uniref:hypothetical protein n=1 Tax=Paracoccus yeei TaxID=147645 RepID=UPI00117BE671|nr:hypothetical protein [Paracoccus yeei]